MLGKINLPEPGVTRLPFIAVPAREGQHADAVPGIFLPGLVGNDHFNPIATPALDEDPVQVAIRGDATPHTTPPRRPQS